MWCILALTYIENDWMKHFPFIILTVRIFSFSDPSSHTKSFALPQRSLSRISLETLVAFSLSNWLHLDPHHWYTSWARIKEVAWIHGMPYNKCKRKGKTFVSSFTCPKSRMKQSPWLKLSQLTGTSMARTTRLPLTWRTRFTFTSPEATCLNPEATPPCWINKVVW